MKIARDIIKKHWDKILLGFFVLLYIGVLSTLVVLRHNAFASNFDLSNMDHTLWNTLYGNFFSLRFGEEYVSRLSVHADFILIVLSPLYLLWDDVRALIILQSIILALGAIPTFLLARKILKSKVIALAIAIAYLLNPGMQWTNIYDFHGVSLAITFMLFAFYFAYDRRWKWYIVFAFLALITKENMSLNIAMLGLVIAFLLKQRWIGFTTFLIGIVWFFSMVYVFMPYFSPQEMHWALADLGENRSQIVPGVVKQQVNIDTFFSTFFGEKALDYYVLLLKPFGFLPLLGFPWLLLSAPEFGINLLRGTTMIHFHYDSGITHALVIATIFGFSYSAWLFSKIKPFKKYTKVFIYLLCLIMLFFALRFNYHYSPLPTTPSCWCLIYNVTEEDKAFEKVLQTIPKNASMTASHEIRPHINHRKDIWFVPSATQSAQFIALITHNRIIGNYEPKSYENELIPILLSSKEHVVRYKSEHFYLFERLKSL